MNEKKLVHNFKSYIGLDTVTAKNNGDKNGSVQELKPKLLNGELVAGAAHSVVLLPPLSERELGRMGSLFVTNYKLSFVPIDPALNEAAGQRSSVLGAHDVPLSSVGALWLTDTGPVRRRRLLPSGDMPGKVKGLQVVCKNMKVLTFNFKFSPIGQGRTIAMALIHHAFPKRHDLLFAYEYREEYYPTVDAGMNMFLRTRDWMHELERCECQFWRITCINGTSDAFMSGASETLIVPSSALDFNLIEASRHFRGGRVPVWTWGRREGAALLRSGELLPTEQAATAESVLLEQVRRSHPKLAAPHIMSLCGNALAPSGGGGGVVVLPPLPALYASYKKLADLCTPATLRMFWEQDSQYYSILESSRWLRHVAASLALAADAAQRLSDNVTVVLQEGDGVDYCPVVSCLAQLLLDPHVRSVAGFQSLVQKEWIALGHPFCDRLGHLTTSNPKERDQTESGVAPVFLLFLDSVWQLTQQFPSAFQFTETYLTTLWDCAHNQLFDTFIFNCPRDRDLAVAKKFIQRPVWDWGEQFTDRDIMMFYNPLYTSPSASNQRISTSSEGSALSPAGGRLEPCASLAAVELWSQCYERWLPPLDTPAGGPVQYQVHNHAVLHQIHELKERLLSVGAAGTNGRLEPAAEAPRWLVPRFHPFSGGAPASPDPFDDMPSTVLDPADLLDSMSLLNAPD